MEDVFFGHQQPQEDLPVGPFVVHLKNRLEARGLDVTALTFSLFTGTPEFSIACWGSYVHLSCGAGPCWSKIKMTVNAAFSIRARWMPSAMLFFNQCVSPFTLYKANTNICFQHDEFYLAASFLSRDTDMGLVEGANGLYRGSIGDLVVALKTPARVLLKDTIAFVELKTSPLNSVLYMLSHLDYEAWVNFETCRVKHLVSKVERRKV